MERVDLEKSSLLLVLFIRLALLLLYVTLFAKQCYVTLFKKNWLGRPGFARLNSL
jgi:hypothetical protein